MKDNMQVYGVRLNGETVLIGDFPMTPRMKAKELVVAYYGGFDPGDSSEASDMYYNMLQLIEYYEQNFNTTPKELT